jgi:tetratricopeptide (TPR) repeat protein
VTTALEGGGGFGKTRLAVEYVHRYGPNEYPGGIFWVNAEVPEDRLEAQMHGILRLLRPLDTPGLEAFRASKRSAARELGQALYALGEPDRALYVVDNVPEVAGRGQPAALDHWCPAVSGVTLLVTSRAHQSVLPGVGRLELRELSTTSAVRLLTHDFSGRDELDDAGWGRISEWVGEWPLALELLNAALREGAVTPRELSASSEGRAVDELDRQMEALSGVVPAGVLRGATEALGVSYRRLPAEGRVAARLLGWLAPAPIPVALVAAFSDGLMSPRARVLLRARSLVSGLDGGDVEMYGRVHRVLADYLRRAADDPDGELCSVCDALVRVMDADACRDPAQWPLMDACRPHAEEVARRLVEMRPSPQLATIGVQLTVHHVGLLLRVQGELEAAAAIQQAAVDLAESALGEEHTDTLRAMDSLGVTLRINGDPQVARRLQERALRIRRRQFGPEHPETLWVMSNLADTLRAQGDRATALRLQEEVLDTRRHVLGAEHPDTLRAMASLGVTLRVLGDLERARLLHEDVLAARRRTLGDEHPDTFDAMAILASTMQMQGEVARARRLEETVLAWRRRFLGERHPGTLWAMSYLAETLRAGGDLRQAAQLAQDAFEGWREVFGESHPDTLWAMGNLAETRRVGGELLRAAELLQTVMERRLSVLGDVHPDTLWAVASLSEVKRALGDTTTADALAVRAASIRRRRTAG